MPFVAKQVRPEGGRPPLMGSALGSEGHGTPPRLWRGCVPYYQHTEFVPYDGHPGQTILATKRPPVVR